MIDGWIPFLSSALIARISHWLLRHPRIASLFYARFLINQLGVDAERRSRVQALDSVA